MENTVNHFVLRNYVKQIWLLLLTASLTVLAGCGGSTSSASSGRLAGNWQFTMANPADNSFVGGLQGGFLQQGQNSVTGTVAYAIALPAPGTGSASTSTPIPCNSGSAPVSGTIDGQNVTLTATAGGQTFTLTGTVTSDGSTMIGTYTSTPGLVVNGVACGTAQSGVQWSASLVPSISGSVNGSFHSKASGLLSNQDFLVTGALSQGDNVGASSATVTGTLTFQNYSCLGSSHQTVNVNGEISGNSIILQMFADNGLTIGQVGQSSGLNTLVGPVVYENVAAGGYILHNIGQQYAYGYIVNTSSCSKGTPFFQDQGNICLASANGTGCSQPISLSPSIVTFPTQSVGSTSVTQSITLTNTDPSGATLSGLSLTWNPTAGYNYISGFSDFNGWPNFTELDSCTNSPGSTFSLQSQQSCKITIFYSPQQSCSWLPPSAGVAPSQCPPFLSGTVSSPPGLPATLTVNVPKSGSVNTAYTVPVSGTGLSAVVAATPEVDFGAEAVGQSSAPQSLSFTNYGAFPVQIFPTANAQNVCSTRVISLPRPIQTGDVDGLRVVQGPTIQRSIAPGTGSPTVSYICDIDPVSQKPNFQISSDSCTGTLLYPGQSCNLNIAYVPQPGTNTTNSGLDYYLELNTQPCPGNSVQPNCEIDSGRFPVELTTNASSPLRMSPGAGLDFGTQAKGTPSAPLTITLTNDPTIPNPGTVNFLGNTVTGDFVETDNCGVSLAPGSSCTLNIVFTPLSTSFEQGTITIGYNVPSSPSLSSAHTQIVHLRGIGQ